MDSFEPDFTIRAGGSMKRKSTRISDGEDSDILQIMPLGGGSEVGRSCVLLKFKNKVVMFDCGLHPGKKGDGSLPYFDNADECGVEDLSEVDVCLITHFHIDHVGAVPFLTEKTDFQGRLIMTNPTKEISPMVLNDFVKMGVAGDKELLFSEQDVAACFAKAEPLEVHGFLDVDGIKIQAYNAGHVLGACMFMIEIAGVRVLYTGDFSRAHDRHLKGAETPQVSPNVLVCESTFGAQNHPSPEARERQMLQAVVSTVKKGGRVLFPVFALGRAQELLLILDEYWDSHPELQHIPIYYGSKIASKCMTIYKKYKNVMNDNVSGGAAGREDNIFDFKHVDMLRSTSDFDDVGPAIVMASPGTVMSGMSRELFEMWCSDAKNTCILPGYVVKGTFAETIEQERASIETLAGETKQMRMQVKTISFSAHSDYSQSSGLIQELHCPNIVLVHGEHRQVADLKRQLCAKMGFDEKDIRTPKNCESVRLQFHGQKSVKIVGQLADKPLEAGQRVSGLLIKEKFDFHLVAPSDLGSYSTIKAGAISSTLHLPYKGAFATLEAELQKAYENAEEIEDPGTEGKSMKVMEGLSVTQESAERIFLEWQASPVLDAIADHVIQIIARLESSDTDSLPPASMEEDSDEKILGVILKILRAQFGEEAVVVTQTPPTEREGGEEEAASAAETVAQLAITVDGFTCTVRWWSTSDQLIECDDVLLKERVQYSLRRCDAALYPIPDYFGGCEFCGDATHTIAGHSTLPASASLGLGGEAAGAGVDAALLKPTPPPRR